MRMSDSESVMWSVEKDPALRSDFCNLTVLEHEPHEDRLRRTLDRALDAIPRLRQRVISPPLRLVPPQFAEDPSLDLEYHVRRVAVPAPGDARAVLDVCEQLAESALDRSRPLWEFTVITGMDDGRAALLQKIHHTISDGVGGLKLSLALLDFEPDPQPADPAVRSEPSEPRPAESSGSTGPIDVLRSALRDAAVRDAAAVARGTAATFDLVTHPFDVPRRACDTVGLVRSVARQGFVAGSARSDLLGERSLRRHFERHSVSLPGLKRFATAHGGSVNDAYVTGICAALGRYHERHGSTVTDLRMAMPVSTRERGDDSANRFAPARVLVPIRPADDPDALIAAVRERLTTAKEEAALGAFEGLSGLAALLPTSMLVAFTRNQTRTIDFAASNLRGSPVPLYLAGARIIASYPFGPRAGAAFNVTTLGYADSLDLGLNVDPAAITDTDGFMTDVRDAFAMVTG
jgi:diacylglycerol O-acyltransferase / wax synthase